MKKGRIAKFHIDIELKEYNTTVLLDPDVFKVRNQFLPWADSIYMATLYVDVLVSRDVQFSELKIRGEEGGWIR